MADQIQFEPVLPNLLLNAVEAVHEVPPERPCIVIRSTDGDSWAVLTAEDAGGGFRETADCLSGAFYRTKTGGLGRGLSIGCSMVDRHGGPLWAPANADHGATFRVALPGER
jgi:two-component system, LuxR family, sensor kinase FixL